MFLKFLKDCPTAGRKLGDQWEAQDEVIARAYINAGYAEEFKPETEGDLVTATAKAVQDGMATLQRAFAGQIKELQDGVVRGFQAAGKQTTFTPRFGDGIENGESEDDKFVRSGGFRTIGHFSRVIAKAGPEPGLIRGVDRSGSDLLGKYNSTMEKVNLARAVSSPDGMYENSEPDGGALVPPDFTTQIWERVYNQESILPRTQGYTVSGNTMSIPASAETSRVDGSRWGGVQGFWEGEAQQLQASRPKFRNINLRLKKLTVMTFVTNELLSDSATALEQYLGRVAPDEIEFKVIDALINGDGAGIPLGILNDPAFIQVAKDGSQPNDTISYTNVMNVYAAMWAPSRTRAVWLYNQEIEPQLWSMALTVGSTSTPVFLPGGSSIYAGSSASPLARLAGRPMIPLEQCPGLGDVGDLILVDWSQYLTITKGSIQSAMSIHLKFDYDETVFRWIFRMDGQGAWAAPLTPFKTTQSKVYSYAVGIQAR